MNRIGLVVQRYGEDINGGAELYTRMVAEKLCQYYQLEVLTTTAKDFKKWRNEYQPGVETIHNVLVRRFKTIVLSKINFKKSRRFILKTSILQRICRFFNCLDFLEKHCSWFKLSQKNIDYWFKRQGPYCPDLIAYLEQHDYDCLIFFTYLFYPTMVGLEKYKHKAILVPFAHNEPLMFSLPYKNLFSLPQYILFCTNSEKKFVTTHFSNCIKNTAVAGIGLNDLELGNHELPQSLAPQKYFVYIGRIVKGKGCGFMIEKYINFIHNNPNYADYKLILIGKKTMKKNYHHPNLFFTGFISNSLKNYYLKNSVALINPSPYESLSFVVLEAMQAGVPIIINKQCDVLYEHVLISSVGCGFDTETSFYNCLKTTLEKNNQQRLDEAQKSRRYINTNYTWNSCLSEFQKAIDFTIQIQGADKR